MKQDLDYTYFYDHKTPLRVDDNWKYYEPVW